MRILSLISLIRIEYLFTLLLVFGIVALVLEIFIPSFGLIGITGGAFIYFALKMIGDLNSPITWILISLIIGMIFAIVVVKFILNSKRGKKLVLENRLDKRTGEDSKEDISSLLNKKGKVVKTLRPSGVIEVDKELYDALSMAEFIEAGESIEIVKVEGSKIICRRI